MALALQSPPTTPPMASVRKQAYFPSPSRPKPQAQRGNPVVWGDFERKFGEVSKLNRLVKLDKALPIAGGERREMIAEIAGIWESAKRHLFESEAKAIEVVEKGFSDLGNRDIRLLYSPAFKQASNVLKQIQEFEADLDAVLVAKRPLRIGGGLRGPVMLVSYSDRGAEQSYVLKYSSSLERLSNRVYDAFARCFSADWKVSSGFLVPDMASVALGTGVHETAGQKSFPLSKPNVEEFRRAVGGLAAAKDHKDTEILISERIKGPNLLDFGYTKYKDFTHEQKAKLFERLGRLAILDLVLGHKDRLIGFHDEGDGYQLDPLKPANLENILVESEAESTDFSLYAIDNGIDEDLVADPVARKKYLAFLTGLFSSPTALEDLTDHALECFAEGTHQIDAIDTSEHKSEKGVAPLKAIGLELKKMRKDLEPPKDDTSFYARPALLLGMKTMVHWLQNTAVPVLWNNSPKAIALRAYLQESDSDFKEAIEERLSIFKS